MYAKRSEMGLPTPAAMRAAARGGRRDGQPSGIGENRASSLTPLGMRQCLMPPPCFTRFGGRMLIGVVVEEFGKSVHGVPVVPVRHGLRRDLAALDEIEVRAAVFDHVGIVVDIVIGEYERIDVAAVASGILAFERGIERGARLRPIAPTRPSRSRRCQGGPRNLARDELGVVALHLLEPG